QGRCVGGHGRKRRGPPGRNRRTGGLLTLVLVLALGRRPSRRGGWGGSGTGRERGPVGDCRLAPVDRSPAGQGHAGQDVVLIGGGAEQDGGRHHRDRDQREPGPAGRGGGGGGRRTPGRTRGRRPPHPPKNQQPLRTPL